ncbi:MAG: TonB-dependent receptor plug domain-containing protein [Gammaproteobacteria bacterium]|nr:TonB-dependent receptor [Gammaproteobacteria bacterium]MDE0479214.1 TonB-dependent receptor [Gammaproteobacteria bacterium]MDE0509298.1 TonB-dependent receptor [Gammaproteobacteria bacterium]MXX07065.1 TonB-dependent receptor plug domain-containing protein [Gammaproteobacteria bacterium]MXY91502.1 TonB-dependent receptor plug domain-containing protein [Gammaproteobacteria bacterium]
MLRRNKTARLLSPAIALALMAPAVYAPMALAQEDAADLEEIIVTGARGRPRTVTDSPVPVDVFSAAEIEAISYTDTNDIIKTLVPSFNISRQPISDGASFIRPASLRGLPTDKTLVLVNSKRRHRAALVAIGGSGTQGPDMATIPAVAIQNIEVLRDGAAAQYGSDAIAGVINFLLKENREGGSVSIDTGQYSEGDGASTTVQGNIGLPLGDDGFLSISGEFYEADQTTRSNQYCEGWFCLNRNDPSWNSFVNASSASQIRGVGWNGNPATRLHYGMDNQAFLSSTHMANIGDGDVVQPWGQPDAEAARVFFNAGVDLDGNNELYGFGNFSDSSSNGSFFYRYPYNGTIEELREPDGSVYFPLEKHPGGFTPRFFGDVRDVSIVGGIRGEMDNGLGYDFSVRSGESEIQYTLKNTINPSMGPDSPTSFRPGDLINSETQLQADFTYELDNGALLAFGASWMDESYDVVQGEEDSYRAGPYATRDPHGFCNGDTPTEKGMAVAGLDCANSNDPVWNVVGVGSNGFPGYSPQFSDVYERNSYGLYGDISGDVTDELFLQAAVRYEDYDDFDAELVWKLAAQLDVTDNFGVRGSIGTAFRAPTPGQQGTTNVSTRLPQGFPVATGLFPAGGPVAQALGAVPLKPEKSENLTFGFTAQLLETIDLTVDFFRIDVEDRTRAISTRSVSTDPNSGEAYQNFLALDAAGVAGANSIGGVFYFTNGFNTSTQGVDIVATAPFEWGEMGTTTVTASFNFSENKFDTDRSVVGRYLNNEAQHDFENYDPNWRGVITARHELNQLTLIGRVSYYGESTNSNTGGSDALGLRYQHFDPTWYTDIEGQYRFNDTFRLSLGARNAFDEYPAQGVIGDTCCGRLWESATGMDWQGAYYYGRLTVDF